MANDDELVADQNLELVVDRESTGETNRGYTDLGRLPSTIYEDVTSDIIGHPVIRAEFVGSLSSGDVIPAPHGVQYTVVEKAHSGGEGQAYLVHDQDGNEKFLKASGINSGRNVFQETDKISAKLARVNRAFGTSDSAFALSVRDVAIVSDYKRGFVSLEDYVTRTNRLFTQKEVVDFLVSIVDGDLRKMHEERVVHGDLHPGNIMLEEEDQRDFAVVDYARLHEHDTTKTMTGSFRGRLGYRGHFEDKNHQLWHDYNSLIKVCAYLLTGRHPQSRGITEETEYLMKDFFDKERIDSDFRLVLERMQGASESKRYTSIDTLARDLKTVQQRMEHNVNELTVYDEKGLALMGKPKIKNLVRQSLSAGYSLLRRWGSKAFAAVRGKLKQGEIAPEMRTQAQALLVKYIEEYSEFGAYGKEVPADFLDSLDEILVTSGFTKIFYDPGHEYQSKIVEATPVYIRKREGAAVFDVLHVDNGVYSHNHFHSYEIASTRELSELVNQMGGDEFRFTSSLILGGVGAGLAGYNVIQESIEKGFEYGSLSLILFGFGIFSGIGMLHEFGSYKLGQYRMRSFDSARKRLERVLGKAPKDCGPKLFPPPPEPDPHENDHLEYGM